MWRGSFRCAGEACCTSRCGCGPASGAGLRGARDPQARLTAALCLALGLLACGLAPGEAPADPTDPVELGVGGGELPALPGEQLDPDGLALVLQGLHRAVRSCGSYTHVAAEVFGCEYDRAGRLLRARVEGLECTYDGGRVYVRRWLWMYDDSPLGCGWQCSGGPRRLYAYGEWIYGYDPSRPRCGAQSADPLDSPRLSALIVIRSSQDDPILGNRASDHYAYASGQPTGLTDPMGTRPQNDEDVANIRRLWAAGSPDADSYISAVALAGETEPIVWRQGQYGGLYMPAGAARGQFGEADRQAQTGLQDFTIGVWKGLGEPAFLAYDLANNTISANTGWTDPSTASMTAQGHCRQLNPSRPAA